MKKDYREYYKLLKQYGKSDFSNILEKIDDTIYIKKDKLIDGRILSGRILKTEELTRLEMGNVFLYEASGGNVMSGVLESIT